MKFARPDRVRPFPSITNSSFGGDVGGAQGGLTEAGGAFARPAG
jgi:hypothetical protein